MDQELLIEERVNEGHKLIIALLRDDFDVTAAFWVRTSEDGIWILYISSETVDVKKVSEAYRRVYACLNRLGTSWISASEVKLIHSSNPISVAAALVRDRCPGTMPTRLHGKRFGPLAVDEGYIYPRERCLKGFEDVNINETAMSEALDAIHEEAMKLLKLRPPEEVEEGLNEIIALARYKFDVRSSQEKTSE